MLLQVSASAEVLPPWKQGDYTTEASYASMTSMTSVSSTTQLHLEKHWEQQVAATREVRVIYWEPAYGVKCLLNVTKEGSSEEQHVVLKGENKSICWI